MPWLITALCLTLAVAARVSVFRNARARQAPPWGAEYPRSPAAYLPSIAGLLWVERS